MIRTGGSADRVSKPELYVDVLARIGKVKNYAIGSTRAVEMRLLN